MHAVPRCDSFRSFSHTGNITTFQTLKNKQSKLDELTDLINFCEFPSLSSKIPFVITSVQHICYRKDDDKSVSSLGELRCRMFTKKNSNRDRLPPILDVLVLYLYGALIFFINIFNIFYKLFFFIYQKYKI